MCSTSAVYDYGRTNPPWQTPTLIGPVIPSQPVPDQQAADAIRRFLKLLDAAKDYDDATGQPNCEDPAKASFMREVLERLAAIEKRLDQVI